MPRESSAGALAAELSGALAGKQVLLPRSDQAGDEFVAALRAAGATVTTVVAYGTAMPESFDSAALETLRHDGADAIAFFSPSAFRNFARIIDNDPAAKQRLRGIFELAAVAAIGPTTAAAIRAAGMPVAVEAPEATAESFIAALERYFAPRVATRERV
jgi:uroporphyrinogen-III synthase